MDTEEMKQAMNTLRQFSEKERDYHAYQARQNYLREQRAIQKEREEIQKELEQERQEKQAALQREETALQEIERLKALLAEKDRHAA
jgi:hypothetical protein